jgi:hypothetical protein
MTKTYDPKLVVVAFGGNVIQGYADGSFVEIAPNDGDGFKKVVGADGEVARSKSNDNTHTVTITLLQTSASNDFLSNIRSADKLAGKSIYPLSVTDINGTSIFFWPEAWIHGDPSWSGGKEVGERQWVLDTGQQSEGNYGGNTL